MSYLDEVLKRKPTKPIYHYTTREGFMGIVKSKSIWARKIQYLSDKREFVFAIELARSRLHRLKESSTEKEIKFIDKMSEN